VVGARACLGWRGRHGRVGRAPRRGAAGGGAPREKETSGGRTHTGEELAERSVAPPSPRSAVASKQGDVLRGGCRAHPSFDDSAAAGARRRLSLSTTLGHART
jgi:hypothetical protein